MFAIYGTTYGAGNGSTTFNLPDFRNRTIWGADSLGYVEAGLPNITGSITSNVTYSAALPTGALYSDGYTTWRKSGTDQVLYLGTTHLDASRSNSIYGGSDTVQPPAIKVRVVTRYK